MFRTYKIVLTHAVCKYPNKIFPYHDATIIVDTNGDNQMPQLILNNNNIIAALRSAANKNAVPFGGIPPRPSMQPINNFIHPITPSITPTNNSIISALGNSSVMPKPIPFQRPAVSIVGQLVRAHHANKLPKPIGI